MRLTIAIAIGIALLAVATTPRVAVLVVWGGLAIVLGMALLLTPEVAQRYARPTGDDT